eukprot:m.28473 g.28473  ORF g.28473 m.28473 type:complete len:131 (-) comp9476_c0_seq1:100-492(-)
MASRVVAYVLMTATQVFGRAFAQAYRQAAANAARGGGQQAQKMHKAAKKAAENINTRTTSRRSGMSLEEAHRVLNVKEESTAQQIVDSFNHLFKTNEKAKGGSFYLQSKVYRAKQTFEDLAPKRITLEQK